MSNICDCGFEIESIENYPLYKAFVTKPPTLNFEKNVFTNLLLYGSDKSKKVKNLGI